MTNPHDYPKVLLVGQYFNATTGGGITLSNIFRDWPKDCVAAASLIEYPPNLNICNKYYQFGFLEYRLVQPLRSLQSRRQPSGPLVLNDLSGMDNRSDGHSPSGKRNIYRRTASTLAMFLGVEPLIRHLQPSRELIAWIDQLQPDLIYTQLGSLDLIRMVTRLVAETHLPLVIHMMDDWPTTPLIHGLLAPYNKWRMRAEFLPLVMNATALMSISHKMSRAFEQRYGRQFITFHNPIESQRWLRSAKKAWVANMPFRLVYAGRIGRANQVSLQTLCDAIAELHGSGRAVQLDLYTLEHSAVAGIALQRNGCVFVHPQVPYAEMPVLLAGADLLILPLDFGTDSIRFAKYSMPTKTAEYMISGAPVLVYAPPDLALTEYARDDKWALIVSEQSCESLKHAILQLMDDQGLREQLGRRAQELAIQNHDSDRVCDAFRQVLAEVAAKHETQHANS